MITVGLWAASLWPRLLSFAATLLTACLEVLIKPAAWLLLSAAILGGYVYGGHVEKAACGRAMQTSVDAARTVDRQAAEAAHATMQDQIAARDVRAVEADRQIKEYEDALAKQPDRRCDLDDDDLRALDRMSKHRVPGRPKGPASGR